MLENYLEKIMNKNKIAIDARMIEASGIGKYIQYILGQGIYDVAIGNKEQIRKYDAKVEIIEFESSIYGLKGQLLFPQKELKKRGVTLIHFPHYNVPLFFHLPFVVTIHDLTHIVFPEFLGSILKYSYAKLLLGHACRKSRHIMTVSEYTKQDIVKHFGIAPEKITVTYNTVENIYQKKNIQDVQYLHEKYPIPKNKKLLMFVGNLKPHKNLSRLLQALAILNKESSQYFLILVGQAFNNQSLVEQEKELGIAQDVLHTGFVELEELVDFYNLVDLFVFPSLYEGFGIPLLEAMACGTPVAASNASSIPEVAGEAAVYFDPYDVDDMAGCIKGVMADDELRDRLIQSGYEREKIYMRETGASKVKEVINVHARQ
jgi:glycosyltransferase involved in cell wall biosynthesis